MVLDGPVLGSSVLDGRVLERGDVRPEGVLLVGELGGLFGVHDVEPVGEVRRGERDGAGPQVGGEVVRLGLQPRPPGVVDRAGAGEVRPDPLDRVLGPPAVLLGPGAVLGRIVRGGVGAQPVGEHLDQLRPLPGPGPVQGRLGDRLHGQRVVAVDPYARDAEPLTAAGERDDGLAGRGHRDGPLVVGHDEDDRGVVAGRPDERLVHVALGAGPVAEERQHRPVVGAAGAGDALGLQCHRPADRVQRVGADDDRVAVEPGRDRVPAPHVDTAPQRHQVQRVDPADQRRTVLAVGREAHVGRLHRPHRPGADRLLAQRRRPQAQLALPLQGGALGVQPAGQHHVAQQGGDVGVGAAERVVRIGQPYAVDAEQADHPDVTARRRSRAGHPRRVRPPLSGGGLHGHEASFVRPAAR
ncbi:hypothetical protein SDC9_81070 [bioreactor metagenome]|uniref:Uncharacterized protein n=1 Tax=bioreactor metagenome TaxID=1076179 RepID=A0A644Z1I9_9ZZZZ